MLGHCWLGDRKDIRPVKKELGVHLLVVIWSFARLTAPVVTTTLDILNDNNIQNGDVLVPYNPDPSGKWPLEWTEIYNDTSLHRAEELSTYTVSTETAKFFLAIILKVVLKLST